MVGMDVDPVESFTCILGVPLVESDDEFRSIKKV